MKVLYVTNMFPSTSHIYNGIHVKEQINYLTEKYKIEHHIYYINGTKSKINYFNSIFRIPFLVRKNKFDLIHIHFGLSGLFLIFNPFIKIPIILTLHGSDTKRGKAFGLMLPITKLVAKKSKKIIIINNQMERIFQKIKDRLIMIPCGVNIQLFEKKRSNDNKKFKIGFPGDKNRPGKNYLLFSKILKLFEQENVLIDIIIFHNLTREQVVNELRSLDCLLMTSLYEGSPQIIKEAMAVGIPIITTNVGDVDNILANVSNCYVVNSFDEKDFIAPLKNILSLGYQQRVTNGKQKLRDLKLDQDSIATKIYSLYNQTLR